jgi:hypothetical protein
MQRSLNEKNILAQRRKDAKKNLRNAVALCVFAPLRERFFSAELLFVQANESRLARKVLKPIQRSLNENNILAQRRKGAKAQRKALETR